MNAVESFQSQVMPLMESLIEYLAQVGDSSAHGFFTEIYGMLGVANEEAELLEVCLALSTSAFQGFAYDAYSSLLLDDLLARAEQLAMTFSASDTRIN